MILFSNNLYDLSALCGEMNGYGHLQRQQPHNVVACGIDHQGNDEAKTDILSNRECPLTHGRTLDSFDCQKQ